MKWGNTILYVLKGTYTPPFASVDMNIIELVPGTDNTNPSNVIQQGGRSRYKVSFEGAVWSFAEYQALEDDWLNGTQRTFEDADGYTATMIIASLEPKERIVYPLMIKYSITLMEA